MWGPGEVFVCVERGAGHPQLGKISCTISLGLC